ncbi:hypothetical protein H2203_003124 [Taxawa tesnikishii (nom. ined.)]|nr:hypothetical protein H2203_003124 [Dothideales sp. JES 119]
MSSDAQSFVVPFLGALQASVAVLLTIFYGVLTAQFGLMSEGTAKDVSKACVKLFLPALLIVNVGQQLHSDTAIRYVPVVIWSLVYNILSMIIGIVLTKVFKLPSWSTPAIAFNNTTALPLLLVQSLDATGILKSLDSSSDAVDRAKSYFLVNAMIGNSLTFALGPKLLNGQNEDAPDGPKKDDKDDEEQDGQADGDVEQGEADMDDSLSDYQRANENTSLLHNRVVRGASRAIHKSYWGSLHIWERLPPWAQQSLNFMYQFVNPPLIGALIGAIVGLTPAFHRLFFNEQEEGGYFNAWLTSSIKNIGDLFASLQVIVVGVKLSQAMLRMKKGEESGAVPWTPMVLITLMRFIIWPLISIPLIWALVSKTNLLSNDPILWFSLMLMPTGPPALKLTALADVNGADEKEKMSIAKFLTMSYVISPLLCFTVVGSLKASEAALK